MIRPASIRTGAALAASLVGLAPGTTAQQPVRGFPAGALPALRAREAAVQAVPATDSLSALMRRLTARPHMAGTPASREVAETMLARWRSYGLDARIEQFEAMLPVPTSQVVELLGPRRHIAVVREPALTEDPDTGHPEHLPAFAAYSADGDATGEVVYVNYGQLEDYRLLDSMGVDLRGRIVLSRAGGMPQPRWRLAAERGATAVIVYHDPRDEGFYHGDTYPDGPRRPAYGIATASIADWGEQSRTQAAAGASLIQATAYPPIPVVPISERDALPFLRGLTGPVAPPAWRGGLPVTYRLGGTGPVRARVSVRSERRLRPLYNVTARIPGALSEDQWVLLGNHHDAWGPGADDPIAGLVALDEAARALATLLRDGWRPARTIVLIAWDGEEWGLLGSKSWVERHAADLRERAVAYLNGDNVQRGWFRAQGPPSLQTFVSELIRDLADPVRGASVLEAWQRGPGAAQPGGPEPAGRPATGPRPFTLAPIGMNADYAPFILYLGVPAVHMAYSGQTGPLGARHSIYETHQYYSRYLDPGFGTVQLQSRTFATAALRLADAPVLPFDFTAAAPLWETYLDDLRRIAAQDPRLDGLDLGPVRQSMVRLRRAAGRFEAALAGLDRLTADQVSRRWAALASVNRLVYTAEQLLTDPLGVPGRELNRHLVQGTGRYSRTGVAPLPALQRTIVEDPDLAGARREAARLAAAIDRYTVRVDEAGRALAAALR